jgi:hypothetical protein
VSAALPRWLVLLPLALAACAHQARQGPPPTAAGLAEVEPWYHDLHALAREAALARGLPLTVAFTVVALDDAEFFERYRQFSRLKNEALMAELGATMKAFSFSGKPAVFDPATSGRIKDVQNEQLLAFYHFDAHQLYVRAALPKVLALADEETRTSLLAHEVGHALQDQLGVTSEVPTTFDAALARRAVLEGDASLTATLVLARRHHISAARAVERVRISTTVLTDEQLLEVGGLAGGLLAASPLVREVFVFPYLRGQRFVADLFAAGGLPLVDAVVKQPPPRSDAILFPQRFLSGRPAKLFEGPRTHRVGALLLRMLFEQCFPARAKGYVSWLDRHYVDDSFSAEGGQLEWATLWEAAEPGTAKKLFEGVGEGELNADASPVDVVSALAGCLGLEPSQFETAQQGAVLGLAAKTAQNAVVAKQLARSTRAALAAPPFGEKTLSAPQLAFAYRAAGAGVTQARLWSHERLGLRLPLEVGERVRPNPGAALTLLAPDGSLLLALFVDEPPKRSTNDAFFNGVLGGFASGGKGLPAGFSLAKQHEWSSRGDSLEAHARIAGPEGEVQVRARVVPQCEGQASVNLVAVSHSAQGEATVERWLETFEIAPGKAPLCAEE